MLQEGYFDEWNGNSYSVLKNNDKYLMDFLAFVAPCLYSSIATTNFITIDKLTISEQTHEVYGDYLCFRIILDSTSKGIGNNEALILAESRVYKGNNFFDENYTNNESKEESIIYSNNFESYTDSTVYNSETPVTYDIWDIIYGCNSKTSAISGTKSLQMRWYTSAETKLGSIVSNSKFSNATSITFSAASTNGLKVSVEISLDGTTWSNKQVFTLGDVKQTYTYNISEIGETVYIRFNLTLPNTLPSSTSRVYIDDIVVNGYES